jgi:hypothetical protein
LPDRNEKSTATHRWWRGALRSKCASRVGKLALHFDLKKSASPSNQLTAETSELGRLSVEVLFSDDLKPMTGHRRRSFAEQPN